MKRDTLFFGALLVGTTFLFIGASAHAQATIDQTKALAGNALPGDAPGFPVTISQRGAYKLTSDLIVPIGASGIVVTASDVNIDLNGYAIYGPTGQSRYCQGQGINLLCPTDAFNGIEAAAGVTDVQVRNGEINGFGTSALRLNERSTVDHVRSVFSGYYAMIVGADSSITSSVARRNGFGGIFSYGGIVADTIVDGNRYYGIVMATSTGGLVRNSLASRNGFVGMSSGGAVKATFMDNQSNNNNGAAGFSGGVQLPGNVCASPAC